ncbi:hypothetical protein [Geminocystis herdmanii]|uniref:hypothetical protein n=1 Tax=Geminocystis herdmanii TaxID=669359 RepID=UPI000349AF02|nr:hypothetical protein [Geminocystis herdmanii]
MQNKIIKLVVFSSLFPLLLIGYNKSSSSQNNPAVDSSPNIVNLQNEVNAKYKTFANNFQEEEQLLKELQKVSNNSPKTIEIQPDIYNQIQQNLNELTTALKSLENDSNEAQKTKIKEVLNLIETPKDNSEKLNLASFLALLNDNKLEDTEICEQIQIPLEIFKDKNDSDCGNFGVQTYQKLNEFLAQQLTIIQTNIDSLKSLSTPQISNNQENTDDSQSQELLNNNHLLIIIIITLILNLGSIGLIIWLILSNKNNQNIIKDLKSQIKNHNSQIHKGELSNKKRKDEIKELNKKIKEIDIRINAEFSHINSQLRQLNIPIKNTPHNHGIINHLLSGDGIIPEENQVNEVVIPEESQNNNVSIPLDKVTPPPISEDMILANLYQENPQSFLGNYKAIRVSMTKDTVNKVSAGTWEGIIELEMNSRNGEYYIVEDNSGKCYLFLNPEMLFNPPTLQQINKSKLFVCNGSLSQTLKGSEVNIIKPATVIKDNQNWRLIQSGEIELIN